MAVTDYKFAGTAANVDTGSVAWMDPDYAKADDDYVTAVSNGTNTQTDLLRLTNFGFSSSDVPAGATINGIGCEINRWSDSAANTTDYALYLIKGGSRTGDNLASASEWPTSLGTAAYGGATNLWGGSWSQSDIVASNFGIELSTINPNGKTYSKVDYIKIRVYYTEGGGGSLTKDLADTLTLSDAVGNAFGTSKADSITLSDALVKAFGQAKADSITLSDAMAKRAGINPADTITLSDARTMAVELVQDDTLTLGDAIAKTAAFTISDTITLSDLCDAAIAVLTLLLSDTLTLSDAVSKSYGMNKTDILTLSEAIAKNTGMSLADSLTLADVITTYGFLASVYRTLVIEAQNRSYVINAQDRDYLITAQDRKATIEAQNREFDI